MAEGIEDLKNTGSLTGKKKATPKDEACSSGEDTAAKSSQLFSLEKENKSSKDYSEYQHINKTSDLSTTSEQSNSDTVTEDETEEPTDLGGYNYKIVDKKQIEEFTCPKCQLILREPVRVSCCGQAFCLSCITSHSKAACPKCRGKLEWKVDKPLESKINSLQVYCENHEKGCKWSGDLSHVEEHTNMVSLTSEDTGVERCQYELTTCKKCDEEMPYDELDHHVKSLCPHRIIPCDFHYAGCDFQGSEISMHMHLQDSTVKHLCKLAEFSKKDKRLSWSPWVFLLAMLAFITVIIVTALVLSCIFISSSHKQELEQALHNMTANIEKTAELILAQTNTTDTILIKKIAFLENKVQEMTARIETLNEHIDRVNTHLEDKIDLLDNRVSRSQSELETDIVRLQLHVQDLANLMANEIDRMEMDIKKLNSGFSKYVDDKIRGFIKIVSSWLPGRTWFIAE